MTFEQELQKEAETRKSGSDEVVLDSWSTGSCPCEINI